MNDFNVMVALLGALILLLALASAWLARSPLPPTLIALAVGIGIGPHALGWLDLEAMGDKASLLEKAARLALGIGLVGVALRIPSEFPRRQWRAMLTLIGLGMPLMWAISTVLVYLILDLPFWMAALIGAIVTPTDPVAATPIVTGSLAERNIPERIRHAISFDSGANDGLGYLFVFLPFLMLTKSIDDALTHWLLTTLLWEVGAATALGLMLGYVFGKLLRASEAAGAIKDEWRLIYTAALGLLAIGVGKLIHSDEVLVVFAAAAAFDQVVSAPDRKNEEQGQEAVNRFFAIPIFILLGTAIPWDGWLELGWSGVLLAVAVLVLRRPVTMLLLKPLLPDVRSMPDALFMGWFGPVAVAAMYYAAMMEHKLSEPLVWQVVSLIACASVVAHGITGAPLTRLYGRIAPRRD
ncbi:cation:proton antiporter [Noviherbaspirillum sp. CPCC 100848]|uniref:Cation:proton antiporter n=1 Tax=Noviherbaspirillum album TaxID=3080276 RepID=A0ABU6JJ72_9BURK|nr:cation:proton antiporter [Noviherbaspirillum sp. CPCC 100848]MEC4723570.1 cation:proton antiporter [Noviherbaspirillum sp. CPCC 100848]